MSDPIETLHEVAAVLDAAGVCPQRVEVTRDHTGTVRIDVRTATRADLWLLCDATKTKRPEPMRSRYRDAGIEHLSALSPTGWVVGCVSFPHHPDRTQETRP